VSVREHRIRACACALAASALLLTGPARAEEAAPERTTGDLAWAVAAYLPNRLFDLCDVVRLHARIGTGFAAGARVTRYLPVFLGDYRAVWVGLPGPRGRAKLPLPAGSEGQKGLEVGPANAGSGSKAPAYGVGEVGAGVMIYFAGVEVGVDVYEIADLLAGFATIDFAHDDF
jgi:hypothetical protein